MKNTSLQILILVLLVMLGCSKDESANLASENNQFKNGRIAMAIEFYSNSTGTESWPLILTENFDGKILKNGNFSGSLGVYGNIDSKLSVYNFSQPGIIPNPDYDKTPNYQNCMNNYLLDFTGASATIWVIPKGKNLTAARDYFTIEFTTGHNPYINLWTEKWGPNSQYGEVYFGGFFNGTVIIKMASANLSTLINHAFKVLRINIYGINLTSGQTSLVFKEIL